MVVLLEQKSRAPERIMSYGAPGSGKTNGWFSIALHTTGNIYAIDTDLSSLEFMDGERYGELFDRITFETPEALDEAIENLEKWAQEATPGEDWLVVDRVDWAWDAAQEEFSNRIFGVDVDEHFMAFREAWQKEKDGKAAGNPFEGFTDWPTIKKRHKRFISALMTATKRGVHWYICAGEKDTNEKLDDATTNRMFGRIGARPMGEKTNPHIPRTVLRLQGNNPNTWRMTTVKDRERPQMNGQAIKDFALDYLVGVAGWQPRS